MVIDPAVLLDELSRISSIEHAFVWISDRANVIMPWHIKMDLLKGKKIGTTGRGIGPAYTDAISRKGIRFFDFLDWDLFLKNSLVNAVKPKDAKIITVIEAKTSNLTNVELM